MQIEERLTSCARLEAREKETSCVIFFAERRPERSGGILELT